MEEQEDNRIRLTMIMREAVYADVEALVALTGYSRTTCIQTAIQVYRKFLEEQERKSIIYIEERNGTLRRITVV